MVWQFRLPRFSLNGLKNAGLALSLLCLASQTGFDHFALQDALCLVVLRQWLELFWNYSEVYWQLWGLCSLGRQLFQAVQEMLLLGAAMLLPCPISAHIPLLLGCTHSHSIRERDQERYQRGWSTSALCLLWLFSLWCSRHRSEDF